jgi:hypothetical protein
VAEAPAGQSAAHDDGETVDAIWIKPAAALDCARSGEMLLLLPTQKNLESVGRFEDPPALIEAARNAREVKTVRPRETTTGGESRILLPGDAGYEELGPG